MDRRHEEGSRSGQPNEGYDVYRRRITARIAANRQAPPGAIKRLLQSPDAFETWLRNLPSDAIVGDFATPEDSPLANFIWESLGVYVDTADSIFDGKRFHRLPEWCVAFTSQEAQYITLRLRDGSDEFTATEVLNLLRRAIGSE